MYKAGDTVGHVNQESMVGTVISTRGGEDEHGMPFTLVKVEWNRDLYMGGRIGEHAHWSLEKNPFRAQWLADPHFMTE